MALAHRVRLVASERDRWFSATHRPRVCCCSSLVLSEAEGGCPGSARLLLIERRSSKIPGGLGGHGMQNKIQYAAVALAIFFVSLSASAKIGIKSSAFAQ